MITVSALLFAALKVYLMESMPNLPKNLLITFDYPLQYFYCFKASINQKRKLIDHFLWLLHLLFTNFSVDSCFDRIID
jgi:hypothetical protein